MKAIRYAGAAVCLALAAYFMAPLVMGILHIGMVYPAALLALAAAMLLRPRWFRRLPRWLRRTGGALLGAGLALLAAVVWAIYSSLTKRIFAYGYPTILTTRRVFFYGILFMLPVLAVSHPAWEPERFLAAENIGNLLFLGLGASALCFVSWNWAVGRLGPVKASAYIYLSPVVTLAASALLLHEPVTPAACLGTVLILGGLVLSEGRGSQRDDRS